MKFLRSLRRILARPVSRSRRVRLTVEPLEDRLCPAINVLFDYSHDSSGFFSSHPQAEALLQQAAQIIGGQISSSLSAITPGSGETWTASFNDPSTGAADYVTNLNVPANTIIIYAGGRNYGGSVLGDGGPGGEAAAGPGSWTNLVQYRGQTGTCAYGPWGGQISFDTSTNWSFGGYNSPPGSNQFDFLSVALHELGHVFGLGTSPGWEALTYSGYFHGSNAAQVYGGAPPVDGAGQHWADGTTINGQQAAMTTHLLPGVQTHFTALDYAGLADIGWQVQGGFQGSYTHGNSLHASAPPVIRSYQDTVGVVSPAAGEWLLSRSPFAGSAWGSLVFFSGGYIPVAGDWDGNGTTTIGLFNPYTATWYLRNSNSSGPAVLVFQFGVPGDMPVVGNWDGSGHTGIGVFNPATATWVLRDSAYGGGVSHVFQFGLPGWTPVTGDWSGDGRTGVGVYDPTSTYWLTRNSASGGSPDHFFAFGLPGWLPVTGDWSGNGRDDIGLYDPTSGTWVLESEPWPGSLAAWPFVFGGWGMLPVTGDWQGVNVHYS